MPSTLDLTEDTAKVVRDTTQRQTSTDVLNALLGRNHDDYHLFFNPVGMHNHIAHHLLTINALGATPEQIKRAFDLNKTYQLPQFSVDEGSIAKMEDATYLHSLFGDQKHYQDMMAFFERRMTRNGWQNVVNEYLFSRSRLAEDMMARMFAGMWHPLLLFGFGVEFQRPAIVAEALAEAACHQASYAEFFHASEELSQREGKVTPLVEIIRAIQDDPSLHDAKVWRGGATFDEDLIGSPPTRLVELVSRWRVEGVEQLEYRTVESANMNAWIAGGAQRADREIRFDFTFMHQLNVSIFFPCFNRQSWISDADKIRLLEWQTRLDLLQYAAELAPPLLTYEIDVYTPVDDNPTWESIFRRVTDMDEDGHVSKMIRALAYGRHVSAKWEAADAQRAVPELPIKGNMWLQLANMAFDSTSRVSVWRQRFVRGAGNDDAWSVVPRREGGGTRGL